MESQEEERMFNKWELLYQWIYPVDWFESSWVFNTQVKQLYECKQALTEEKK